MKDIIILNIAGFYLQINFFPTESAFARDKIEMDIRKDYAGFITKEKPKKIDFQIGFVDKRQLFLIYKKKEKKYYLSFYEIKNKTHFVTFYQISLIQFQIIIRGVLVELLSKNQGFILHASASKISNQACLFTGQPGAGKSTAMMLLDRKYPSLADDTVIVRKEGKIYYFYQTPFIEKEAWVKKNYKKFPVARIFFLKKARLFKTEKTNNREYVLGRLIRQLWTEEKQSKRQLSYLMSFVNGFDGFYFLYFAKDSQKLINLLTNEV